MWELFAWRIFSLVVQKVFRLVFWQDFFWWGGIGGAVTAAIGQLLSREVILEFFPECNLNTSHAGNSDAYCQLFLYVQIVFLAGFWEESFKAIWVFMRFKTKALWVHPGEDSLGLHTITDRVPRRTCCFFATATCTCWWRLAETPEAIFLSTMAAGAGFESIENILYMFHNLDAGLNMENPTAAVVGNGKRALLAVHVFWSGYIGIRLAQRFFAPDGMKPGWMSVMMPPMLVHGLWNWCAHNNIHPYYWLAPLFFTSIALVVVPIRLGAFRFTEDLPVGRQVNSNFLRGV